MKNEVKSIQAVAYNGVCTVIILLDELAGIFAFRLLMQKLHSDFCVPSEIYRIMVRAKKVFLFRN